MLGMAAEYQSTLLADTLYCLVGNMIARVAFYAATYPLTLYDPKKGERIEKPTFAQRLDAADSVFSMPFFPLLMVLALHGTYELWAMGTLHARWHVQLPSTRWFQLLYVTRMATHVRRAAVCSAAALRAPPPMLTPAATSAAQMPVQWVTLQRDPKLRLQMSMHHVLSVVCSGFFDSIGLYDTPTEPQIRLGREWLRAVDMVDDAETPFQSLSYGEQRLVLIARAMVKSPLLLVLDEPTQGLDELNRERILGFMSAIEARRHSTLLFVSHRQDEFLPLFKQHIHLTLNL